MLRSRLISWDDLQRDGVLLDLPSKLFHGVTYRLRVGRRIEVRAARRRDDAVVKAYLVRINPTYPLPELEFVAHLFLCCPGREEEIVRVAAPQPWDQRWLARFLSQRVASIRPDSRA